MHLVIKHVKYGCKKMVKNDILTKKAYIQEESANPKKLFWELLQCS